MKNGMTLNVSGCHTFEQLTLCSTVFPLRDQTTAIPESNPKSN